MTGLTIGFWKIEGPKIKLGNTDCIRVNWVQEHGISGTTASWAVRPSEVTGIRITKRGPYSGTRYKPWRIGRKFATRSRLQEERLRECCVLRGDETAQI